MERPTPKLADPNTSMSNIYLKGYSGVNLIHGLTHRETVLGSLSRDQASRPLINWVLSVYIWIYLYLDPFTAVYCCRAVVSEVDKTQ